MQQEKKEVRTTNKQFNFFDFQFYNAEVYLQKFLSKFESFSTVQICTFSLNNTKLLNVANCS